MWDFLFSFRIDKALLSVVDLIFFVPFMFCTFSSRLLFFFRLFSKCAKNIEFLFSCFAPTSWKCLVRAKFSVAAVEMPQFTTARKTEICDFSRRLAMQDVTLEMSSVSLASSSRADRYFRFWKIMMFHFLRNTYCHCQRIFRFALGAIIRPVIALMAEHKKFFSRRWIREKEEVKTQRALRAIMTF